MELYQTLQDTLLDDIGDNISNVLNQTTPGTVAQFNGITTAGGNIVAGIQNPPGVQNVNLQTTSGTVAQFNGMTVSSPVSSSRE